MNAPSGYDFPPALYERIRAAVAQPSDSGRAAWASPFWGSLLNQRRNFPTYSEMLAFRSLGFAAWIGDFKRPQGHHVEVSFRNNLNRALAVVPRDFLRNNPEGTFGTPATFDMDGQPWSAAGLHNAVTAYRILQMAAVPHDRQVSILEIGAGYGAVAKLLIDNLPVRRYVVCDLPENMFLSASYLGAYFERRLGVRVRPRGPDGDQDGIVFVTPDRLESIETRFDLVVNTYSFQEITQAWCNRYFAFIRDHLRPGGVFYSLNHHGANDVRRPSGYAFRRFDLVSFGPPVAVNEKCFHRKQPYEFVGTAAAAAGTSSREWLRWIDGYSAPLFAGAVPGLPSITPEMHGRLRDDGTADYLLALGECAGEFGRRVDIDALAGITPPTQYRAVHAYLVGAGRLSAEGDWRRCAALWDEALAHGLTGLAGVRAAIGMSYADPTRRQAWVEQAASLSPQFAEQVREMDVATISASLPMCFDLAFGIERQSARRFSVGRARRWLGVVRNHLRTTASPSAAAAPGQRG